MKIEELEAEMAAEQEEKELEAWGEHVFPRSYPPCTTLTIRGGSGGHHVILQEENGRVGRYFMRDGHLGAVED